jgi:uncharacterized Ntn-hydrolase superfamily protein
MQRKPTFFCILALSAVVVQQAFAAIDFDALSSPILFRGDAETAYRDPAAVYHEGVFHLFFTFVKAGNDGQPWMFTATSTSRDLKNWTPARILTPKDRNLNFSSPGNVVRFNNEWILCLQTYPRPSGEKYGNANARLWIMHSPDLKSWGEPELLRVKGPEVPVERMGRMIDPFLFPDKDDPGKWWCFYKQNGVSMSWSRDLKSWTYSGRVDAGENTCVLIESDQYLLFHSPKNGVGVKRSSDLKVWHDEPLVTLGQRNWPWARGRLTAGFVLDLRKEPSIGRTFLFFHGSGPEDERTMFDTHASLGVAWSQDLRSWNWPGKTEPSSANSVPETFIKPVLTPTPSTRLSSPVATFSVVGFDPATEALGVAVQSKFFGVGTVVPWAKAKTGAIATQSYANIEYGVDGLKLLSKGYSARETLEQLTEADPGRTQRQVGVVDARGRVASFTGSECNAWAGHFEGTNFCVQGNILASKKVITEMAQAYLEAKDSDQSELADWLMAALVAGQAAGGDKRGQQSAALLVVREHAGYAGKNDRFIDLRVEDHPRPIEELARLLEIHKRFYGR